MWTEHRPKWTYILISINILVFLLQRVTRIWPYLAFTPALATFYPWTILTSIFLHVEFNHLLFNMFALFLFGTALEGRINNKPFITLFLFSGLLGNIGYYLTTNNSLIPVLGASGSIYGVIGTLAILEPFRLVYFYGMVPLPMILTATFWAIADFYGLFIPSRIAHGAHLLGMLIGVITGLYLRRIE